jgi:hypothetical protein
MDPRVRWFDEKGKSIPPPPRAVDLLLSDRELRRRFRPLRAVIAAPTLRPDGSLLSTPGYDAVTESILAVGVAIDKIPDAPSRDEAERAWRLLRDDALGDFPFVGDVDRAVALAALLTLVGRRAFAGPAPMFGVSADRRGTGKDLLVRVLTRIALGRPADSSPPPRSDSELRRRVTAIAREGSAAALLSNVEGPLGGAALEDAVTATTWSDRLLNRSSILSALPMEAVWFATGNRLATRGDMARRLLTVRLQARDEFPELRSDFRHPDLLAYVGEHRGALLRAALLILRAYIAAGRPEPPARLGSFEAWSGLIGGAV